VQRNMDAVRPGWAVIGSDGEKIGDVTEVRSSYLLLQKGLIFVKDIYVPMAAVQDVELDGERVMVDATKDGIEDKGWDEPPADTGYEAAGAGTTTSHQSGAGWDAEIRRTPGGSASPVGHETEGYEDRAAATRRTDSEAPNLRGDRDRDRVELHEERLGAETRRETVGEVGIDKRVVEQEQELEVPVTREEVEVRRVRTDRPSSGDDRPFAEGDTIRVPVTAEQVDVTRDDRVVEEIEVTKRPITEKKKVSGTVRREEVDVSQEGDVHVADEDRELAGSGASRMSGNRDWQNDPEHRGTTGDPALGEPGTDLGNFERTDDYGTDEDRLDR
jgi:uncharacterized protein (TIGR02271 family)